MVVVVVGVVSRGCGNSAGGDSQSGVDETTCDRGQRLGKMRGCNVDRCEDGGALVFNICLVASF